MEVVKFIHSLRFKLISATVIFILLPIMLFTIIYSSLVKDIIIKKYSESAIQSVYQAGKNIDFVLNDIKEFSNVIVANRDFLRVLKNTDDMDFIQARKLLRSFFTLRDDIDGIEILSGENFYSVGVNKVAGRAEYMQFDNLVKSDGQIVWIKTRYEKIKILSGEFDKYYFSLGRKLFDFNSLEEIGVMALDIDEAMLEKSYKNLVSEDNGQVFICNRDGEIISHPDKSNIGKSIKNEIYAETVLSSQNINGQASFKDNNVEKIVIYTTCNINGWKIVKIVPNKYLYKEIEVIQWNLITAGILYVLITICMALLLSVKITEPVINMMKIMRKAERGNLDVRLNMERKDEIGQLGTSFNNMISETKILIEKLIEEERLKKEIELEVLHAQINPHFLYNTLNTIKWMAKIQGAKSISNAVTALIKLLRISINLGRSMISLSEEIEYVKNYTLIQKLRFNENFSIDYIIENECLLSYVPKLILQPIVENSIIYGLGEDNSKRLNIEIKAYRKDNSLIIEVNDNGPGIKPEVLRNIFKSEKDVNKFSTVGLNNVNQRIRLFFGGFYGIKINTNENMGTRITIAVPYSVDGTA